MFRLFIVVLSCFLVAEITAKIPPRPSPKYPKGSVFWATDFFVRGCKTFLEKCPQAYKYQLICAKSVNGDYRDFANYCEMQYENCNTWRNWHIFKRERC